MKTAKARSSSRMARKTFPESIFSLNIIGEDFRIYGDPERIRQMLDKIIENGMDFRTPGSPLEIQLARLNGRVAIRVFNQGPLLPEKMRQQIFQSMVSVRRKKGRGPHLGLGLYVARKIAEFHSGNIRAENRSDDPPGVAFIITLPLSDEQ